MRLRKYACWVRREAMAKQWPQMIGIGSSVYDTLMMVPRFPEEDTKLEGLETKVQGGGPAQQHWWRPGSWE